MRGRAKEFHSVALLNNIVCNNVCNCCLELSGKCLISSVLSRHNKRWSDEPALQLSDRPVSQLHFTAQFHLENKGKYILEAWGHKNPKTQREEREHPRRRETPGLLAPLFICFFLPLGLPYVNWASQECCFFLPEVLGPSFLYLRGLFPSLSFSHRHSGLLFPILTT